MGKVKIEKTQAGERSYEYQFPMGKVKKSKRALLVSILIRINSLWER